MYQFIETIRVASGNVENIFYHQQRVNRTLDYFKSNHTIDVAKKIVTQPSIHSIIKARVVYSLTQIEEITYSPYSIKPINSVKLVEASNEGYDFKYANRDWLKKKLLEAKTDEIIIIRNKLITDASYANLTFFDGTNWLTPQQPLLLGTRRAALLDKKIIKEAPITINDLQKFSHMKFINAMMLWDESPVIVVNQIKV
jgi:4-amino-4-deoxychorismate lyase